MVGQNLHTLDLPMGTTLTWRCGSLSRISPYTLLKKSSGIPMSTSQVRAAPSYWFSGVHWILHTKSKVNTWMGIMNILTDIAATQSHAAYSTLKRGISTLWLFTCRTTPDIHHLLQPIEECLCSSFIPAITSQSPPNKLLQRLFSLPARLGGLNTSFYLWHSWFRIHLTSLQASLHLEQSGQYSIEIFEAQEQALHYYEAIGGPPLLMSCCLNYHQT